MSDVELQVLNVPSPHYTFTGLGTRRRVSDIDVTLLNGGWIEAFDTTWELVVDRTTSDHNLLSIAATRQLPVETLEPELRWRTREADWNEYVAALRTGLRDVIGADRTLEEQIESLHVTVQRINDAQFPRLGARMVRTTRWWTPALRQQCCDLRRSRNRWQAARSRSLFTEGDLGCAFHRSQLAYNRSILAAKEQHWREYVCEEGNSHPWGQVYRFCRGKRNETPVSSIIMVDG